MAICQQEQQQEVLSLVLLLTLQTSLVLVSSSDHHLLQLVAVSLGIQVSLETHYQEALEAFLVAHQVPLFLVTQLEVLCLPHPAISSEAKATAYLQAKPSSKKMVVMKTMGMKRMLAMAVEVLQLSSQITRALETLPSNHLS